MDEKNNTGETAGLDEYVSGKDSAAGNGEMPSAPGWGDKTAAPSETTDTPANAPRGFTVPAVKLADALPQGMDETESAESNPVADAAIDESDTLNDDATSCDDAENHDDAADSGTAQGNDEESIRAEAEAASQEIKEELAALEKNRHEAFGALGEEVYNAARDDSTLADRFRASYDAVEDIDSQMRKLEKKIDIVRDKANVEINGLKRAETAEANRQKVSTEAEAKQQEAIAALAHAEALMKEAEQAKQAKLDAEKDAEVAQSAAMKTEYLTAVTLNRSVSTGYGAADANAGGFGAPGVDMNGAPGAGMNNASGFGAPSASVNVAPGFGAPSASVNGAPGFGAPSADMNGSAGFGAPSTGAADFGAAGVGSTGAGGRACPQCGAAAKPDDVFCMKCGTRLPEAGAVNASQGGMSPATDTTSIGFSAARQADTGFEAASAAAKPADTGFGGVSASANLSGSGFVGASAGNTSAAAAPTGIMPSVNVSHATAPATNRCPACGAIAKPGDKFCMTCGTPLGSAAPQGAESVASGSLVCPNCGAERTPQDKFCMFCGHKL